jgi:hypothetical protein
MLQNLILEVLNIFFKAEWHALKMVASSPECSLKYQCECVESVSQWRPAPRISTAGSEFSPKVRETKSKESEGQETEIICAFLKLNVGLQKNS